MSFKIVKILFFLLALLNICESISFFKGYSLLTQSRISLPFDPIFFNVYIYLVLSSIILNILYIIGLVFQFSKLLLLSYLFFTIILLILLLLSYSSMTLWIAFLFILEFIVPPIYIINSFILRKKGVRN